MAKTRYIDTSVQPRGEMAILLAMDDVEKDLIEDKRDWSDVAHFSHSVVWANAQWRATVVALVIRDEEHA